MEPILSAEETKKIDQYTSENGWVSEKELMERAARAVEKEIITQGLWGRRVLILSGMGNNGADGLALARMLMEREYEVELITVGKREKATPLWRFQRGNLSGLEEYHIEDSLTQEEQDLVIQRIKRAALIVDAIFGVGLRRDITGSCKWLIESVNGCRAADATCIAIDMPSGISTDTGAVCGCAVKADCTVTFGYRKRGQLLYPGADYCGRLVVADIGFADYSLVLESPGCIALDGQEMSDMLPCRHADSNKGSYGKLLMVVGSNGMAGAAVLSATAAYRTGCGLVYVRSCEENRVIIQNVLPEAVYFSSQRSLKQLCAQTHFSAAVIGPGIGKGPEAQQLLAECLETLTIPLVLDADALNLISEDEQLAREVKEYPYGVIMTPHRGEMARLLKTDIAALKADPLGTARQLAEAYHCVCVAKDSRTVISGGADHEVVLNLTGNDGMATGGSGDVLAGILGGLLAQDSESVWKTAVLGVYLHGRCGDVAAARLGKRFMLARDIIDSLSEVLR